MARNGAQAALEDVRQEIAKSGLEKAFNPRTIAVGAFILLLFVLLPLSGKLVETNTSGWYTIKQSPVTGRVTAYTVPGMFIQSFGDVFKYKAADIIYFSKHEAEGKDGDDSIVVRFNDGATARVTGNMRISLPADPAKMAEIHANFRSYDALIKDTVKQVVSEAVILTAALMSAEESYTTKRAEFSQMADDQVKNGIYLTEADTIDTKDPKTGETTKKQIVDIQLDKEGKPERKPAVLAQYGIRVSQFIVKEIDYQESVDAQINTKQQALMKTVSAKAEAEKAVQDRLTAEEVGKKNVAVARYEQEVEKTKSVTQAERDLQVAELKRKEAEQYKQKQILTAEGDSEYRRKIMAADGALQIKLQAYVDTQKAWADAMAHMSQPVVPSVMMGGTPGSGGNAAMNMMELMALKAAKDLQVEVQPEK
jgi:hypothetical protein